MKKNLLLVCLVLLAGCNNEGLDVKFRTVYTTSTERNASSAINTRSGNLTKSANGNYTQFGGLIGTITPRKVTAKFNSIRYIDQKSSQTGMQTMVEIISTNWPDDDARRQADFSNGNTVEVTPEMYGNIDNDGWFVEDNITLRYLGIFPQNFNFEFDLPAQYENKTLNLHSQVPGVVQRAGNVIKCEMRFLLQLIKNEGFDYESGIQLKGFVFGETDQNFIVGQNNIPAGDVTELISMAQPHAVVRSGNYTCPVLTPPANGKSKIITTTIGFDTQNIIQLYAGYDNVPYTADDIFVLQPGFWDRFSVTIDQN